MKYFFLLNACWLVSTTACRCKKKVKVEVQTEQSIDSNYLKISFISFASGIDYAAFHQVRSSLDSFNRLQKDSLEYAIYAWGREGELNLCIRNNQPIIFKNFATYIDSVHSTNPRIHILQTGQCSN